ncbi:hypothetical protein ACIQ7Q_02530 [Streptomyces sp. NPDC096176]|uniref:hypothetical protein n=1 Tax=Streptomyces sp. NPDC096176 TaxID=3366079 RepID=UPI00382B6E58
MAASEFPVEATACSMPFQLTGTVNPTELVFLNWPSTVRKPPSSRRAEKTDISSPLSPFTVAMGSLAVLGATSGAALPLFPSPGPEGAGEEDLAESVLSPSPPHADREKIKAADSKTADLPRPMVLMCRMLINPVPLHSSGSVLGQSDGEEVCHVGQ